MSTEEHSAVTFKNEAARLEDMRRRKIADFKFSLKMKLHGIFWRFLHLTWLARPYSVFMCRLGLYGQYPDGRCQWCGIDHKHTNP